MNVFSVLGDHFDRERGPHLRLKTSEIRSELPRENDCLGRCCELATDSVLNFKSVLNVKEEAHLKTSWHSGSYQAAVLRPLILIKQFWISAISEGGI
jgi:hypothetical protein